MDLCPHRHFVCFLHRRACVLSRVQRRSGEPFLHRVCIDHVSPVHGNASMVGTNLQRPREYVLLPFSHLKPLIYFVCDSLQQQVRPADAHKPACTQSLFSSLERIMQYVTIEKEPEPTDGGEPPAYWPSSGHIRVEKLSARYSPDGPKVLENISFDVKAGERIGIGELVVVCAVTLC